jgi:SAM-dependent methyltransferase
MMRLAASEVAALDPYKFMATIGKRVIHPGGRASTQALLARARITPASRVLDVGCGVATTALEIAGRFGAQVTAVDIAPLMLERAEANARAANMDGRVTVRLGDICALPFADDSFDVVIAEAVTMFADRPRAQRTGPGLRPRRAGAGHRILLAHPAAAASPAGVPRPGMPRHGF